MHSNNKYYNLISVDNYKFIAKSVDIDKGIILKLINLMKFK